MKKKPSKSKPMAVLSPGKSLKNQSQNKLNASQQLYPEYSEHFAPKIIESALTGIYIYDFQIGWNVYMNPMYERITGHSLQTLEAMTPDEFSALFHPEDQTRIARHMEQISLARDGETIEIEYRFRHADGRWIWCLSRDAVFQRNQEGQVQQIIGSLLDVTERKKMEHALRESEGRFREVLETSLDAAYRRDLRTDLYDYLSPVFEKICGYSAKEMEKLSVDEVLDLIHPDDRDRVVDEIARIVSGGSGIVEYRFRDKEGNYRWLADNIHVLLDENGAPLYRVGAVRDISRRKRAEQILRESEEKWKKMIETLPQLVWTCTPDGKCDFLSKQWLDFTGRPEEEQLGYRWLDQVHRDDLENVKAVWENSVQSGNDFEVDFRIRRHDGAFRWFKTRAVPIRNENGQIIKWYGSNTDIHIMHEMEQARLALDLSRMGTWSMDVQTGKIDADDRTYEILKFDPEAIPDIDTFLSEYIPPEEKEYVISAITHACNPSGDGRYNVEYRIVRPDKTQAYVAVAGQTTFKEDDSKKKADRLTGTILDITTRKESEKALSEAHYELQERVNELRQRSGQLARLAAELTVAEQRERRRLATILHDNIQQLIVAAGMHTELLQDMITIPEQKQKLDLVSKLMDETIMAIRNLTSDLSPPILYQEGLPSGLRWLAEDMKRKHGMTIHIDVKSSFQDLPENLAIFLFTSARELLFNVAKHAGTKESVVKLHRKTDWIILEVRDEGKGFKPSSLFKTDGSGGFGLFSIRERLELLGGKLTVESRPGEGSRFILTIPDYRKSNLGASETKSQEKDKAAKTHKKSYPAIKAEGRTLTVLVADDHHLVREGLVSLLEEQEGIEVIGQAENGEEAIQMVEKHQPEVVIMDISMPVMDGIQATSIIKKAWPHVRIIGLSMYGEAEIMKKMRKAGADGYLQKKEVPEKLIKLLITEH